MKCSALALSCGRDGTIKEFLLDEAGFAKRVSQGQPFRDLVDSGSRQKADRFLQEIQERTSAVDWELVAALGPESRVMHFTGGRHEEGILIVGAETAGDISGLIDDLMRVNNEQANALRKSLQEAARMKSPEVADPEFYNKLSRVNNELAGLQREMAQKNAQLLRLNREKDQLLGTAAHDLRNPLGTIKMYAQLILGGAAGEINPKQESILQKMQKTAEFMLRVVEDTLDLSQIESGIVELRTEPTDLSALVDSVVETSVMYAQKKQITIRKVEEGTSDSLNVDPQKMEQVLQNLVSNAVKYSEFGTEVTISLKVEPAAIVLSVIDQGQGIPLEAQSKLFQPFAQVGVKSTAGEKSTGLGLAIVKRLVEAHGGTISVDSEPGRGSEFRVILPRSIEDLRVQPTPELDRTTN